MFLLRSLTHSMSKYERNYGEFTCPVCHRSFVQLLPPGSVEIKPHHRPEVENMPPEFRYVCSHCHRPLRLTRIFNGRGEEVCSYPERHRQRLYPYHLPDFDI